MRESASPVSTGNNWRDNSRILTAKRRKLLGSAAYIGVLLFYIFYFFRPGEFIPALDALPLAKVPGVFVGLILIAQILSDRFRWVPEMKLLLILYAYLCICIPTSTWVFGSFDLVINGFSKFMIVIVATMGAVNTLARLRTVMLVQTIAMLTLAILSHTQELKDGRMFGAGTNFSDPNELALNLCIVLPFCVALFLFSQSKLWKICWASATIFLLFSIVSTSSRGGFLALVTVFLTLCRQFTIRTRTAILLLLIVCALVAVFLLGNATYLERISTIATPDAEASAEQRQELLIRSLELTIRHPIFGVGPGLFQQLSGYWHETHNTYTQLSAEAGIPALIIFLAIVRQAFKDLRLARDSANRDQMWYLAGAVYCSLAGYLVGAFFLSTAFSLVPYLVIAYCAVLRAVSEDSTTPHGRGQRGDAKSKKREPSKGAVSTTIFGLQG